MWLWEPTEQLAFAYIKKLVTYASCILSVGFADAKVLLELHIDTSKYILRGALLIRVNRSLHPMVYYNQKYCSTQYNYSINDRELLALVDY